MGGSRVFRVRADDPNRNVIIETLAENGARSVMAQAYLPAVVDGDKRILIIGFADSRGGFDINLQLSRGRAEAVRRALFAVQPSAEFKRRVTAKGYSELAPVNCNDNDVGREFNRRVEIWIY